VGMRSICWSDDLPFSTAISPEKCAKLKQITQERNCRAKTRILPILNAGAGGCIRCSPKKTRYSLRRACM
jgi:hypothetical protein